uniref:Uncharacterized protein n=1 Tax=Ananas comosus var. bracteatus TaxID=296719 RepID=A0A6V7PNS5_ANACO|nr:unnamed protein product [Ananas comosus var. bracteatus]
MSPPISDFAIPRIPLSGFQIPQYPPDPIVWLSNPAISRCHRHPRRPIPKIPRETLLSPSHTMHLGIHLFWEVLQDLHLFAVAFAGLSCKIVWPELLLMNVKF